MSSRPLARAAQPSRGALGCGGDSLTMFVRLLGLGVPLLLGARLTLHPSGCTANSVVIMDGDVYLAAPDALPLRLTQVGSVDAATLSCDGNLVGYLRDMHVRFEGSFDSVSQHQLRLLDLRTHHETILARAGTPVGHGVGDTLEGDFLAPAFSLNGRYLFFEETGGTGSPIFRVTVGTPHTVDAVAGWTWGYAVISCDSVCDLEGRIIVAQRIGATGMARMILVDAETLVPDTTDVWGEGVLNACDFLRQHHARCPTTPPQPN